MMTRQKLLSLPPVKLPAARKTLSSTHCTKYGTTQEDIVINPLHHPGRYCHQPIAPSMEPPRNIGVLFDSTCCLNDHVNTICQNINYQLYSIGKIRKYLDKPTTEKMINSAVTSRLDYCNSPLYGINGYLVSQLQRCQNNAARIVSLRCKFDHITPVLKDLHWLPVEYRINYKGCRFDIMDNKSYFFWCVLIDAIIYVLIHQIIFRFYLLKNSLFFQVLLY